VALKTEMKPLLKTRLVGILEDEVLLAAQMTNRLGAFGFEAYSVRSFDEVKRVADERRLGSFVLDVQIDGKRVGLDALSFLKDRDPRTFVCIYSGYVDKPELRRRAERLGADFVQQKTSDSRSDVFSIARALMLHEREMLEYELGLLALESESLSVLTAAPPIEKDETSADIVRWEQGQDSSPRMGSDSPLEVAHSGPEGIVAPRPGSIGFPSEAVLRGLLGAPALAIPDVDFSAVFRDLREVCVFAVVNHAEALEGEPVLLAEGERVSEGFARELLQALPVSAYEMKRFLDDFLVDLNDVARSGLLNGSWGRVWLADGRVWASAVSAGD